MIAPMLVTRLAAAAEGDSTAAGGSAEAMADRIVALEELTQTHQSDLDKLKRFKFSGYIQARWETAEFADDSVRVAGSPATITPANNERFYIRRGRFKLTYDASPLSQAVIYFDGNTGGSNRNVTLLEAYLTLIDPWTPDHRHQLTGGQFNIPFGYEIERSSSLRELPERSRAENVLFTGERDRGLKLVNPWTPQLETVVSVLNGDGVNDANFPTTRSDRREGLDRRAPASRRARSTSRPRTTTDTPRSPLTGRDLEARQDADRRRRAVLLRAADAGRRLAARRVLRSARTSTPTRCACWSCRPTSADPVTLLRAGADPSHLATDFIGGYVMWVQNLGEKFQFAARYDWFDPNTDLDHDQYERVEPGRQLVLRRVHAPHGRLRHAEDRPAGRRRLRGSEGQPLDRPVPAQVLTEDDMMTHAQSRRTSRRSPPAGARARLAHAARGITVKGSDTMVILGQRWAETYMNSHPGAVIQVTGGGSGTGIAALINGTTDICHVLAPDEGRREAQAARPLPDAWASRSRSPRTGSRIYVHEIESGEGADRSTQLKQIYTGQITNWKAAGRPRRADHPLRPREQLRHLRLLQGQRPARRRLLGARARRCPAPRRW